MPSPFGFLLRKDLCNDIVYTIIQSANWEVQTIFSLPLLIANSDVLKKHFLLIQIIEIFENISACKRIGNQ